jgi:hypothetical protein
MGFPIDQALVDDMKACRGWTWLLVPQTPGGASRVVSHAAPERAEGAAGLAEGDELAWR